MEFLKRRRAEERLPEPLRKRPPEIVLGSRAGIVCGEHSGLAGEVVGLEAKTNNSASAVAWVKTSEGQIVVAPLKTCYDQGVAPKPKSQRQCDVRAAPTARQD